VCVCTAVKFRFDVRDDTGTIDAATQDCKGKVKCLVQLFADSSEWLSIEVVSPVALPFA
jgi:hypothetical protein